jgi:hypothetical protein
MSKKAASPLHIEWSVGWVRALNVATGEVAVASSLQGLGNILRGHREALVGVGRKLVFLKAIRLPKAAPDDLRRIVTVQLAQIFPLPADQLVFDFMQTGDVTEEGSLTVVAAIRADDLRQIHADLQHAGLTATRVLPIAMAAASVAASAGLKDALVIEQSEGGVALDVVKRRVVRFSRVASEESDPEIEAQRTLAASGAGSLSLVVVGDLPLEGAQRTYGAALSLLHETPGFSFDLPEDRERRVRSAIAVRYRLAIAWMAIAVIVASYIGVTRHVAASQVEAFNATWTPNLTRLNEDDAAATNNKVKVVGVQQALDRVFNPAQPLSDIISVVGDSLPDGAWLTQINLERGKPMEAHGTAKTSADVGTFVGNLALNPRFRDVRIVFANGALVGKIPVVQFDVTATCVGNLPMPVPQKSHSGLATVASAGVTQ